MSDMMRPSEEERRLAALVAEHVRCTAPSAQYVAMGLSERDKVEIRYIVREEIQRALALLGGKKKKSNGKLENRKAKGR